MAQARQILSLIDRKQISCDAVKSIADDHIDDVRARITDLRKIKRTLNELYRRCSGKGIWIVPSSKRRNRDERYPAKRPS